MEFGLFDEIDGGKYSGVGVVEISQLFTMQDKFEIVYVWHHMMQHGELCLPEDTYSMTLINLLNVLDVLGRSCYNGR